MSSLFIKSSESNQFFHIDVTVSVPAMLIVSEGVGNIEVCETLNTTIESINRDIIITLFTRDRTGKLIVP